MNSTSAHTCYGRRVFGHLQNAGSNGIFFSSFPNDFSCYVTLLRRRCPESVFFRFVCNIAIVVLCAERPRIAQTIENGASRRGYKNAYASPTKRRFNIPRPYRSPTERFTVLPFPAEPLVSKSNGFQFSERWRTTRVLPFAIHEIPSASVAQTCAAPSGQIRYPTHATRTYVRTVGK